MVRIQIRPRKLALLVGNGDMFKIPLLLSLPNQPDHKHFTLAR